MDDFLILRYVPPENQRAQHMSKRILVALDFDHTIIDKNSDNVVRDLVAADKIPDDVQTMYCSDGWTAYMGKIFQILHQNGITPETIQSTVNSIPVTPGIDVLLKYLLGCDCEVIIISDSNSEFINGWLDFHNLTHTVRSVFTNPAFYDDKGCLHIKMYHLQTWCRLSTKNLCKGYILQNYIEDRIKEGVQFSKIAYIGDGKNDLCPSLKLKSKDFVFARIGYTLMESLQTQPLQATICPWSNGHEIIHVLSQVFE